MLGICPLNLCGMQSLNLQKGVLPAFPGRYQMTRGAYPSIRLINLPQLESRGTISKKQKEQGIGDTSVKSASIRMLPVPHMDLSTSRFDFFDMRRSSVPLWTVYLHGCNWSLSADTRSLLMTHRISKEKRRRKVKSMAAYTDPSA